MSTVWSVRGLQGCLQGGEETMWVAEFQARLVGGRGVCGGTEAGVRHSFSQAELLDRRCSDKNSNSRDLKANTQKSTQTQRCYAPDSQPTNRPHVHTNTLAHRPTNTRTCSLCARVSPPRHVSAQPLTGQPGRRDVSCGPAVLVHQVAQELHQRVLARVAAHTRAAQQAAHQLVLARLNLGPVREGCKYQPKLNQTQCNRARRRAWPMLDNGVARDNRG